MRLPEVKAKSGLGSSSIYAGVADKTFPAPIKIGPRASAWLESEIDAWIAARVAERDGGQSA
ncbi:AlpA family transcriptional regulator [Haliea sp. E1-2-M8]|uniref:helix-turn-helix transcriptional regulator n=1 Tax=Haliea sp. E1-2-M8 TaxID=3064706 RepID=UPI00271FB61B|nr:AlpA family transcriptional regulator [Haliea sp. E1-2-M8]MDO8862306.1 AlpA family transcriptional regulator [Haliea sp. E1-2-M8]